MRITVMRSYAMPDGDTYDCPNCDEHVEPSNDGSCPDCDAEVVSDSHDS